MYTLPLSVSISQIIPLSPFLSRPLTILYFHLIWLGGSIEGQVREGAQENHQSRSRLRQDHGAALAAGRPGPTREDGGIRLRRQRGTRKKKKERER